MPLISIITVTYNAASTLEATLVSVSNQTFKDYEYLVIDGASTDSTVALAESAGIARVISEPDGGLYDAMNKGLHLACGHYVLFLNAGDILPEPSTLRKYADAIAGAPRKPGIVYGQTYLMDKNNRYIGERHLRAPENLTSRSFINGMVVCHQAMLVRRDIAPDYDLSYRFSADYDWGCKILKASDLNVYIPDYVAGYLSEGLTTANRLASLRERFRSMARHYGFRATLMSHLRKLMRLPASTHAQN